MTKVNIMPGIAIDHLDDGALARLSARARAHGRAIEEEARDILQNAVKDDPGPRQPEAENIGLAFHRRFAEVGGWDDFQPPPREPIPQPPEFE